MTAAARATKLRALRAHTAEREPGAALAALARELEADSANAILLFCSGEYDLAQLGAGIRTTFQAPVAACTTAGQIGAGGFVRGGITGVSLHSSDLRMRPLLLSPLSLCRSQA